MKFIYNAKVKTKLVIMAVVSASFLILVGSIGLYYLNLSNDKMINLNENQLALQYSEEIKSTYNSLDTDLFELMVTTDTNRNAELIKNISIKNDAFPKIMADYDKIEPDPFEVDTLKVLKENLDSAAKTRTQVVDLAGQNKNDEAYALFNSTLSPLNAKIEKNLSDLTEYNIKSTADLSKQNEANFKTTIMLIGGIILLSLIVVLGVSIFITGLISKPIVNMEKYIEKVSKGDFSEETLQAARHVKLYNDEIGMLGRSVVEMRQQLWNLMSKVAEFSEQIASSSQELNANAEESSKGVEETARAVDSIVAGIENQLQTVNKTSDIINQMSGNTEQVASNASDTSHVSEKTLRATDEGEKSINITKEQMMNIEKTVVKLDNVIKVLGNRSNEIGQIVETISSIAEQTNLLALNAAIEAARAGEQGKGFAVVAEEVRHLAESSQEATLKISSLIGEIQKDTDSAVLAMNEGTTQVRIGMEVVDKAGQSFGDISKLVHEITSQIQEIAAASESIAKGNMDVVSSMNTVDQISNNISDQSQTIAASVEEQTAAMHEIALASEGLAKIGEGLISEVSKFKL